LLNNCVCIIYELNGDSYYKRFNVSRLLKATYYSLSRDMNRCYVNQLVNLEWGTIK